MKKANGSVDNQFNNDGFTIRLLEVAPAAWAFKREKGSYLFT
jgi:hypothetical protein